jgi:hypothetical protein
MGRGEDKCLLPNLKSKIPSTLSASRSANWAVPLTSGGNLPGASYVLAVCNCRVPRQPYGQCLLHSPFGSVLGCFLRWLGTSLPSHPLSLGSKFSVLNSGVSIGASFIVGKPDNYAPPECKEHRLAEPTTHREETSRLRTANSQFHFLLTTK